MDDLVTWLRAQLDDDEQTARAVPEAPWAARPDPTGHPDVISVPRDRDHGRDEVVLADVWRDGVVEYAVRFDPDRQRAEVDAKRRILDLAGSIPDQHDDEQVWYQQAIGDVLRRMALPYVDRPGYHDEWKS